MEIKTQEEIALHMLLSRMHDTLVMEVTDYLRTNGMTRTDFADKIGVSKGYISQFLNGKSDHKLSRLVSISLAVGKHPHIVFSDPPNKPYQVFPEGQLTLIKEDEAHYGKPFFLRGADIDELSRLPILKTLTDLKEQIDHYRPLPKHISYQLLQKFRFAWNYNSNAIEGNELTYGETVILLMNGLTAKGKPLKDHLDIEGHERAVTMMLDMIKGQRSLSQNDVRQLHQLLLKETYQQSSLGQDGEYVFRTIRVGEYKRHPNHVKTVEGPMHYYAPPGEVPSRMSTLLDWYNEAKDDPSLHPLVAAMLFHHEFVAIHPFDDGNGRMGRILMNFTLMRKGYPPIVVPMKKRKAYYQALSVADKKQFLPLTEYLAEHLKKSLNVQLQGASSGRIEPYQWDEE
ncbi:MAG: Fic family protein/predicted XRE-type DNA-binding protein [Neolewinella sp.]|jgi:Fic family protein/predicted XRE-type DNA-binding protein